MFIAKHKNKIVGSIVSFGTVDGNIFLADWVVDEKYRNLGIGKKLYNRLVKNIKNRSLITFVEFRYKESINFHKKRGFKIKKIIKDVYGIGEKENYYIFIKKF